MNCPDLSIRQALGVYLVTDRPLYGARDLLEVVRGAVAGGTTMVQLREKACGTREFVELARAVVDVTRPAGVPLLINDRVDVAIAAGVDGVHVGQSDMAVADVRTLLDATLGAHCIVGLSVQTYAETVAACAPGARIDYIGLGPVHSTATKPDAPEGLGLAEFSRCARYARQADMPVVAIGGLGVSNAAEAIAAGADGVAVVSAIVAAHDPKGAAQELAGTVATARTLQGRAD